jgi:hypothetical protein
MINLKMRKRKYFKKFNSHFFLNLSTVVTSGSGSGSTIATTRMENGFIQIRILIRNPAEKAWVSDRQALCGTGTVVTVTFCRSETGTVI